MHADVDAMQRCLFGRAHLNPWSRRKSVVFLFKCRSHAALFCGSYTSDPASSCGIVGGRSVRSQGLLLLHQDVLSVRGVSLCKGDASDTLRTSRAVPVE